MRMLVNSRVFATDIDGVEVRDSRVSLSLSLSTSQPVNLSMYCCVCLTTCR